MAYNGLAPCRLYGLSLPKMDGETEGRAHYQLDKELTERQIQPIDGRALHDFISWHEILV